MRRSWLVGTNFLSTHPPSLAHNPTAKQYLLAKAVRHQEWLSASVEPVTSRRPGSAEHVPRRVPVTPDSTAEVNKTPRTNDGTRVPDTCPRSPRKRTGNPKLRYMRFPHGIRYDSGLMYRHTKHFLGINCARPIHPSSVRIHFTAIYICTVCITSHRLHLASHFSHLEISHA